MLKYKGYSGVVEYDEDGKVFTGEVIGLRDVITFQGRSPEDLELSFRNSIDFYLEMCSEDGSQPDKPYSGRFNLRVSPEIHRRVVERASQERASLNQWVSDVIERAL